MFTVYFRFAAHDPVNPERAPLLEQLLARAEVPVRVSDWRADALRIIAPQADSLPPASAAAHASGASRTGQWAFIATPVHFVAGLRSVSMPADGILTLDEEEAAAMTLDFNRLFGSAGIRLHAAREQLLLCTLEAPLRATTHAPEELQGRDIWDFMPRGPDAAQVRRLMSEIEMWLHEHAINERRAARADPLISGLWFWGGGGTRPDLPEVRGWTGGKDPLFEAFGAQPHYPGAAGSGVVVIPHPPGSAGWRDADERWLAPAAADLKAGRVQQILLSAGHRCFRVSARGARRFWRRTRPWWESFQQPAETEAADTEAAETP